MMIKRDYFVSGRVARVDGSSYRVLYNHYTVKSWLPDTAEILRRWIAEQRVDEGEALEIISFSRLPRWF